MPTYDFCCIASAAANNQQLIHLISKISGDVLKRGGVVRRIEHYGLRPLAYEIKYNSQKHDVGRYFRIFVQASPLSAKEDVSHRLKIDENILRFRPFVVNVREIFDTPKSKWLHTPKITEGHYDALKRTTNIDYYIARTLLDSGKITEDEIKALGTHNPALEPQIALFEQLTADKAFEIETQKKREAEITAESIDHLLLNEELDLSKSEKIYAEEDIFN